MPQKDYPQHTQCLISGSKDLRVLKGYERHYLVKSYPLGFVFCSSKPSEQELLEHYSKYCRQEYYSPITRTRYGELLESWEPYRKTNKIIDIGCGTGFFLEVAKEKGWEVYGTEYAENAVSICKEKGINMQKGRLNPGWYDAGMFDVVTSFEVLEHIINPVEEIRNIHSILRQGGLFYITTPNFNAVERFILKEKYNVIEYPEHLCHYTPKTLKYLLAGNGFKNHKIRTTGISFSRLKVSRLAARNIQNKEALISASSRDEVIRERSEKNILLKAAKNIGNTFLNLFKSGNSLKAWCVKE
jgi:2-polyprenyl-3-methyl-5-hydroxy-6-metoxy-1,4-benzoquinol methylase